MVKQMKKERIQCSVTAFDGQPDGVYDCPVGVAFVAADGQLRVLVAPAGHHQELCDAYRTHGVIDEKDYEGLKDYVNMETIAFGRQRQTDPLPIVHYIDRHRHNIVDKYEGGQLAKSTQIELAARALWLTLECGAALSCIDGQARTIAFSSAGLAEAVIEKR
mgnify:CR=1 FL=1